MEEALSGSGSLYNRAWRIHHNIGKTLERLLLRRFKNEVSSHMPHEVFNITWEDEDLITEEEATILLELGTEYEKYKISVRGIISRLDSYY